jgi:hypothetical protein
MSDAGARQLLEERARESVGVVGGGGETGSVA